MKNLLSTCLPLLPLPSATLPASVADPHRSDKSNPDPQESKRPGPDTNQCDVDAQHCRGGLPQSCVCSHWSYRGHPGAAEACRPVLQICISFMMIRTRIKKPYPNASQWKIRIRIYRIPIGRGSATLVSGCPVDPWISILITRGGRWVG